MTALRPHPRPEVDVDYDALAHVVFAGVAQIDRLAIGGAAERDRDRPELVRAIRRRVIALADELADLVGDPHVATHPASVAVPDGGSLQVCR